MKVRHMCESCGELPACTRITSRLRTAVRRCERRVMSAGGFQNAHCHGRRWGGVRSRRTERMEYPRGG